MKKVSQKIKKMIHKTIVEKKEKSFTFHFFFRVKLRRKKKKIYKKKQIKMKKKSIIKVKINVQYAYEEEQNENKIEYCEKKNQNLFRKKIFQIMRLKNRIKISGIKITKIIKFLLIKAVSASSRKTLRKINFQKKKGNNKTFRDNSCSINNKIAIKIYLKSVIIKIFICKIRCSQ